MDLILALSITIRLLAMVWSVVLLRRLRDWRIGVLTAMFALMATRQILAVATTTHDCLFCFSIHHLAELPGLIVSILAFLVAVFLGRMLVDHQESEKAIRQQHASVKLLQKITAAANTSKGVDEALRVTLKAVCRHTGWPVGHVYMKSKHAERVLDSTKLWHLEDHERFETFQRVTESTPFDSGVGLPGRVLASAQPAWIVDVTQDPNFPRAKAVEGIGVHAGFAFPVLIGDEVAAVLEFFSARAEKPDPPLLEVMASVGTELGRAIERERSAQAIRESERLLQSIIDNTSAVISIKDIQGRFLLINRRFEEIFKMSGDQIVGKTNYDIFPKELADAFGTNDRLVIEHQRTMGFEEIVLHADDNEPHTYISDKFPLYDTQRQVYAVCGISTDITQRKRDEENLRFTRFLVDHASDAVFTINKEGRFIAVNETTCSRMEYSRDELMSMSVWDIDLDYPAEAWPAMWQRVAREKHVVIETSNRTKNGRVFPVEIAARHIEFEGAECICAFVRDVTARKQAEAALKQSEERLQRVADTIPGAVYQYQLTPPGRRQILVRQSGHRRTFRLHRRAASQGHQPGVGRYRSRRRRENPREYTPVRGNHGALGV